jgi:hypothetical protein
MKKIVVRTDPYGFGIIIPMKTGVVWEHQCDGYACHQLQQEGIFIPLKEGYFDSHINDLGDREYHYSKEKLPFEFNVVEDDFSKLSEKEKTRKLFAMMFQEAWEWITFLGWKDKTDFNAKEFDKLIGKKVLLVYQNSD